MRVDRQRAPEEIAKWGSLRRRRQSEALLLVMDASTEAPSIATARTKVILQKYNLRTVQEPEPHWVVPE
jgi:hypothetical protein